jgi:hypothetical protein
MTVALDHIHHIAVQVKDLEESILWYTKNFACQIAFQDNSWALLKFDNLSLALVHPDQHPPHFAVTRQNITLYGTPVPHRGLAALTLPHAWVLQKSNFYTWSITSNARGAH